MDDLSTTDQMLYRFRAQPGIAPSRLAAGTKILVETSQIVYEIELLGGSLVRLSGSDRYLASPKTCRFVKSVYDPHGLCSIDDWITKSMRMVFQFADTFFMTNVVQSASVHGDGYKYDVF